MPFKNRKTEALNNLYAAERTGDLDMDLKPLLDAINALSDYYTTSSCSGRVGLLEDLGSKKDSRYLMKWHRKVAVDEVLPELKPCKGVLWFRYESPILHVMAKTPEKAEEFLIKSRESGFKRSGIQSLKDERILVEVLSTERIDAPIMADGKLLVQKEFVRYLVEEANKKYETGMKKLERLLKQL
jgi:tRNA wybutosine-synthesizing protein 3